MDAACVQLVEQKVRDFPTLVCIEFSGGRRFLAFHGAVHGSVVHEIGATLKAALQKHGQFVVAKVRPETCLSLEWCDYATRDGAQAHAKDSVRQSVSRTHTDRVLAHIDAVMTVGGHQDNIESIGLVNGRHVQESDDFRISPYYKESADLFVVKSFCDLDAHNERCRPISESSTFAFTASAAHKAIVKTSLAYTCKTNVNGSCFLDISPLRDELTVTAHVFPKRYCSEYTPTPPVVRWDDINSVSLTELSARVNSLAVVCSNFEPAYKNAAYKTIGKRALLNVLDQAQRFDAHDSVAVVRIPHDRHVIAVGDIHSNIHGFLDVLMQLKRQGRMSDTFQFSHDTMLLLLGDYGDRGPYGLLVHWLIFKLIASNDTAHFMAIRGNHEQRDLWRGTGMIHEFYNMLP